MSRPASETPAPFAEDPLAAHADLLERRGLAEHAAMYRLAREFAESVRDAGGQSLLVGGCVRDMILGAMPKDYDMEVRGLPAENVLALAEQVGSVADVGKAYGVLKLQRGNVDLGRDEILERIRSGILP